jgi:hypothetical protein
LDRDIQASRIGGMKTTLRRIPEYTPTVVMGLLIVTWVVGLIGQASVGRRSANRNEGVAISYGDLALLHHKRGYFDSGFERHFKPEYTLKNILGGLAIDRSEFGFVVVVPIPLLITIMFPLVIGPFASFRFRIWHCLGYAALVALELAYYLRWQK